MIRFNTDRARFEWRGPFEQRHRPKDAGWSWSEPDRVWWTSSPFLAYAFVDEAEGEAAFLLDQIAYDLKRSHATERDGRHPLPGLMPFQEAGAWHAVEQLEAGRRAVLIADEQGLGKTVQALAVANIRKARRVLVVCPAGLRLNWAREMARWYQGPEPAVILTFRDDVPYNRPVIVSYEQAHRAEKYPADLVIVDELHYLKTPTTKRTKVVLGNLREGFRGLVAKAPAVLLTGTPVPNRPIEFWPVLFRCAPDVIDNLRYWDFARRFCLWVDERDTPKGSKNEAELWLRLRGSGFMIRRLKQDVLKDLPPKRHKLVVLPPDPSTRVILDREREFSAREILDHGVPVGTVLPELRREMGLAKAPDVADYVEDLLEEGAEKVVVMAHHRDVVLGLQEMLAAYGAVVVMGGMSNGQKQTAVDRFQTDPTCRVLVGNLQAAGVGWTLTAACDIVFAECSWVPGENAQAADRVHRIGQTRGVIVHYIVVQGSLDAYIMGAAAEKAASIEKILDGAGSRS